MLLRRELARPAPHTLATVVYVPDTHGYWEESLNVLELCLDSLRRTTPPPFEILVVDNGSCSEVRNFLESRFAAGEIDQLFLSRRNLGKVGAWNLLFSAAEGELVTYTDSDIYFLPGWFEASRAVLGAFPETGVVTAQAMSRDLTQHIRTTLEQASADPTVEWREGEDLVPRHFVESHLAGLGESPESYARRIPRRRDVLVSRDGTDAFVSSAHFQFTSRRADLRKLLPLDSSRPMGDVNVFDAAVDEAGLWRLSTTEYLVHHMGNRVPDLDRELPWADAGNLAATRGDTREPGEATKPPRPSPSRGRPSRRLASLRRRLKFSERRPVRRLLKWINRWSHELLYPH